MDQRDPGQRDRDRILHSSALRRLAGVTQVAAPGEGQVFHNRLTHTLKVAQIGRRLAEKLLREQPEEADALGGLDPEVVEAAALAHDLGHPPFGHTAEARLNQLVTKGNLDGYEGNAQSFRIVNKIAVRRSDERGLNLTRATLNAMLKYPWLRQTSGKGQRKWGAFHTEETEFEWTRELYPGDKRKSAEAELMDWADDIAYSVHDAEDFYRAGFIPLDRLRTNSEERQGFLQAVFRRWREENRNLSPTQEKEYAGVFEDLMDYSPIAEPYSGTRHQRGILRTFVSGLIGRYIGGIRLRVPSSDSELRVDIEQEHRIEMDLLKQLTWHYVIENPSLATQRFGKERMITELFTIFLDAVHEKRWSLLPLGWQEETKEITGDDNQLRFVADIISGMTDGEAIRMYQRLTGISLGSILDLLPS